MQPCLGFTSVELLGDLWRTPGLAGGPDRSGRRLSLAQMLLGFPSVWLSGGDEHSVPTAEHSEEQRVGEGATLEMRPWARLLRLWAALVSAELYGWAHGPSQGNLVVSLFSLSPSISHTHTRHHSVCLSTTPSGWNSVEAHLPGDDVPRS